MDKIKKVLINRFGKKFYFRGSDVHTKFGVIKEQDIVKAKDGDVVKSNINKKIAEDMKNDWNGFKKALTNLESLLKEMKIDISRFSSSWNVLLLYIFRRLLYIKRTQKEHGFRA